MNETVSLGGLFLEGLLSFFSPCVLPLIPLYIGYLTSGTVKKKDDGTIEYNRVYTAVSTLFFVLGICTVFFLMAAGAGTFRTFLQDHQVVMQLAGGILLALMGLTSFGVIRIPFLEQERRFALKGKKTGLFGAWLLGFFFSFAWSPCIGPLLASALMASAAAETAMQGFLYIGAYTLGFVIFFVLLGLFTEEVLAFLQKHRDVVKYTGKLGAAAVTGMGCWMLYQGFKTVSILEQRGSVAYAENESSPVSQENGEAEMAETQQEGTDAELYGFRLMNAEGEYVSLTDYTGKTVIVNFFGTWCTYCNLELPHLQEIEENRDDVKILMIAAPNYGDEKDQTYIEDYLSSKGYTMEVLYDTDLEVTMHYGISGYPTTYIVQPDGNFLGYVPGYADQEALEHYIEMAQEKTS